MSAALHLRDSFSLAFTKFKIRRIRTILTLLTMAVGAYLLILGACGLGGLQHMARSLPQSKLSSYNFASVSMSIADSSVERGNQTIANFDFEKQRHELDKPLQGYKYSKTFPTITLSSNTEASQIPEADSKRGPIFVGVGFEQSEILQPFVSSGQSLKWSTGEPLPVIINSSLIADFYGDKFDQLKPAQARAEFKRLTNNLVGKTFNLTLSNQWSSFPQPELQSNARSAGETSGATPTQAKPATQVRVVGIAPQRSMFIDGGPASQLSFPVETTKDSPFFQGEQVTANTTRVAFDSKDERNRFVMTESSKDSPLLFAAIVDDPEAQARMMLRPFNTAFVVILAVFMACMAIPIAATISKVLTDSTRETGVFRAIGASNAQMIAIYAIYALIVITASYLLAALFALATAAFLDWQFGGAINRTTEDSIEVGFSFLHPTPGNLTIIYLAMLGAGIIGSFIPLLRALKRDPIKALRDE